MTKAKGPRGAPDILPPASELLTEVEDTARALFDLYGYRRIETPSFESTDVFVRSVGESSDIVVQKQMYTFPDPKGRSLTLRPEGTAPVVRAYVEHRPDSDGPLPVRLYYIGPFYRYERPQKGRNRQFVQIGVEAIGSPSPVIDAEIILLGSQFYRRLGLEPHLLLNSMGCADDRARFAPALKAALEDRADALCEDCLERLETNPMRVFDCKVPECREAVRSDVPAMSEFLCEDCRRHEAELHQILEALGVAWKTEPELVRGLDYYTRTVFEFDLPTLGARSAVGGGGRYDGLVKALGGPDVPGVGMAVGVEPVMVALKEVREAVPAWRPEFYIAWLAPELAPVAMAAAADLREAGRRVTIADEARSLRSQLREAGRLQAAKAVILGADEVQRGVATVKDLQTGDQTEVPLKELA